MPVVLHRLNHMLRYYDFIMAVFVTMLLYSGLIGAFKAAQVTSPALGPVTFGAGVLLPSIFYIPGDIPTEVYGCGRGRRVVQAGSAALIFASFTSLAVPALPMVPLTAGYQRSLNGVFGNTPRTIVESLIAFWCGSFANSYTLARMEIMAEGKWLWTRIVRSTAVSEAVDPSLSYVIAFYGIWSHEQVLHITIAQCTFKTGWEIVATPLTYRVVASLKRAESEDYYDRDTSFASFRLKV